MPYRYDLQEIDRFVTGESQRIVNALLAIAERLERIGNDGAISIPADWIETTTHGELAKGRRTFIKGV